MPSLADVILSADAIVAAEDDEEDDPEFAAMALELAELQARRRGAPASPSAQASSPTAAGALSVDVPVARLTTPNTAPSRPTTGKKVGTSLADTILNNATGEDSVDQELENMEKELQRHISQYKSQCQEAPSLVAAGVSASASSQTPRVDADVHGAGGGTEGVSVIKATDAELIALQVQAARMDDAFPEIDPDPDSSDVQTRRSYRQLRTYERSSARDAPTEEMEDMRSALDDLDIRLRAMQQREVMQDRTAKEEMPSLPESSEGNAALASIRAQSEHLRARLHGAEPKGLLNLDRSFFAADGAVTSSHAGYAPS